MKRSESTQLASRTPRLYPPSALYPARLCSTPCTYLDLHSRLHRRLHLSSLLLSSPSNPSHHTHTTPSSTTLPSSTQTTPPAPLTIPPRLPTGLRPSATATAAATAAVRHLHAAVPTGRRDGDGDQDRDRSRIGWCNVCMCVCIHVRDGGLEGLGRLGEQKGRVGRG